MRKVTFGVANSLDNFIGRADGAVDWLLWSKDVSEITSTYWKTIDTVLMGRKTYAVARGKSSKGDQSPYPGVKCYVFSSTLKRRPGEQVEIISSDAVEFVRALKAQVGKDICVMGGGEFARALFAAGLIDEVGVNVHPVLLGNGIPLFLPMDRQIDLELLECRPLAKGCVYLLYRVKPRQ